MARVLLLINPAFFEQDFRTIRQLANASTIGDILAEVNSFRAGYQTRSKFLREVLRIRISGKRLLKLARRVLR